MSDYRTLYIDDVADDSLARVKLLLAKVPDGVYRAVGSAMKRAGDTARTQAAKYASETYAISQSTFRNHVKYVNHFNEGKAEVEFGFKGYVIPLIEFDTKHGPDGKVLARAKRKSPLTEIDNAFFAQVYNHTGVFERKTSKRFPIEQKYGPSAAHMMNESEEVVDKMDETVRTTFDKRIEHEISRILNGYGG